MKNFRRDKVVVHFLENSKALSISWLEGARKGMPPERRESVMLSLSHEGERCVLGNNIDRPGKVTGWIVEGYRDFSEFIEKEIGDDLFVKKNYYGNVVWFNKKSNEYVSEDHLKPPQELDFILLDVEIDQDYEDKDDPGEARLTGIFYLKMKKPLPDSDVKGNHETPIPTIDTILKDEIDEDIPDNEDDTEELAGEEPLYDLYPEDDQDEYI